MPRQHLSSSTTPPQSAASRVVEARRLIGLAAGFVDCAADVLDEMVAAGQFKALRRGQFVARRGDAHVAFCMVVDGLLETSTLQADGHRHFLGLVPPGNFTGFLGLVVGAPHPHDLVAREPSTLLAIALADMHRLRERHPTIVLACERQVALRMQIVYERLAADPGLTLESRAASMLLLIGRLYGRVAGPHIELDFKLPQSDLADWLGLSRQRVNFALKRLEAEGLIRLHYSTLTITDPAGLAARAGR